MRNLKVTWVGKTKEAYLAQGIQIYEKKITPYTSLKIQEIKDSPYFSSSKEKSKQNEAERVLKNIHPSDFVIICDEKGKDLTSLQLATHFEKWANQGNSSFHFVIGGAFGFSENLYQRANFKLSLSKLTFTHQMIRLFLLEQIYRCFTIINNQSYHH